MNALFDRGYELASHNYSWAKFLRPGWNWLRRPATEGC